MKNLLKLFGITALVAVVIFSMTACDTGGSPDPFGDPGQRTFTKQGSFSGNEFILNADGVARAVSAQSYLITGRLKLSGGSTVLTITGTYDSDKNEYTASAADNTDRYLIYGPISGNTATVLTVNASTGNVTTASIANTNATVSVTLNETASGNYSGTTVPDIGLGMWRTHDWMGWGVPGTLRVAKNSLAVNVNGSTEDFAIINITQNGSTYTVTLRSENRFQKFKVSFPNNTMKVEVYGRWVRIINQNGDTVDDPAGDTFDYNYFGEGAKAKVDAVTTTWGDLLNDPDWYQTLVRN